MREGFISRMVNCIRAIFEELKKRCRRGSNGTKGETDSFSSRCNSFCGKYYDSRYKVFKCPECKQKLRVPRGKGKIMITCRRCQYEFIKRT